MVFRTYLMCPKGYAITEIAAELLKNDANVDVDSNVEESTETEVENNEEESKAVTTVENYDEGENGNFDINENVNTDVKAADKNEHKDHQHFQDELTEATTTEETISTT